MVVLAVKPFVFSVHYVPNARMWLFVIYSPNDWWKAQAFVMEAEYVE